MNTAIARIANAAYDAVLSAPLKGAREALHTALNEQMPAYSEDTRALVYTRIIDTRASTRAEFYDAVARHI